MTFTSDKETIHYCSRHGNHVEITHRTRLIRVRILMTMEKVNDQTSCFLGFSEQLLQFVRDAVSFEKMESRFTLVTREYMGHLKEQIQPVNFF